MSANEFDPAGALSSQDSANLQLRVPAPPRRQLVV
jgi:hypothetical protein